MSEDRPTYNGRHDARDSVALRDYFEALRRTDLENQAHVLAQLELRLQQRYDAQEGAVNAALLAAKEAVSAALLAAKEAVEKAEISQQRQNAGANEAKAMLTDTTSRMWPISEGQSAISALENKLTLVSESQRRELGIRIDNAENLVSQVQREAAGFQGRVVGVALGASALTSIVVFLIGKLVGH